ncbi:MAG: hypothetical protein JW946_00960 [Candidatus Omnitrophica bacterium]|nr:hypothetical protein [Candidatus Omnitrophota bacterium]
MINNARRYFLVVLLLVLCMQICGCGLRGFVKNIQKNIENFGVSARTGQGDR